MIQNIIHDPNQTQFTDWRQDLLTNEIVNKSCRSFTDALVKTVSFFLEKYLSLLLAHLEKYSIIDSYLFLLHSNETNRESILHSIWLDCWMTAIKNIDMSIMNQTYMEIPLVFDLHLPCATIEYEIIRQIRQTTAQNRQDDDDDDENWIDFAYKQLVSISVYGQFINVILNDSDLFDHYYHDQLTLARNEANIHQLSTSFVQHLLTSKISGTTKDRLSHLLIDYEELLEIMRIFEIGTPLIGEEDAVLKILDQQFIDHSDEQEKNIGDNNKLYRLVMRESNFHLIHPGSSAIDENIFECNGNPFIEVSLMNLLELLITPTIVDNINNMKQLLTVYGLLIQSMTTLSHYDHYEINNLEKVHSLLRLASCLSTLFPNDKALEMFKQIYRYSGFCISFTTLDDIHNFITYLRNAIQQQQSTVNETNIHQTLLKFENELLKNWSISNTDQCGDILEFINNHNLWRYSAKAFTVIDKCLKLSSIIREKSGQMPENDEYENINNKLNEMEDPTHKIEVLMSLRIYMQLILDENYQPYINENNRQLTRVLIDEFNHFKKNLDDIEHSKNERRLERISLIAWLKYYLLHYVYALKYDMKDDIMEKIDKVLVENTSAFYSTVKLYIIKQLCHTENITFHELCSKYTNRKIIWIRSMIDQPSNQRLSNARRNVILPTPLFEYHEEFKRIDEKINPHTTNDELKDLINECSKKQGTTYCFLLRFIHYYTRFYMKNVTPDEQSVRMIEHDVSKELITSFEPIGYKLIYSLCTNFNEKSYFQLKHSMSQQDLHQRLLILNIIALLISFKSVKVTSFFSFLLFDGNLKMPENYVQHFNKLNSLTGVTLANDSALIQMIYIRTQIDNSKNSNINIFRCSSDCSWLFYFINCEISDEHKQCPLCKKQVNISRKQDVLIINKPHLNMNNNETLQFISQYIEQYKKENCIEKPDHLSQSLTYHFMNFFTHAIFLFLNELNYMPHSSSIIRTHFQQSIKTDYSLLRQYLSNVDQCYIWLYKLINHMMNEDFIMKGYLPNSSEKVIQLEKQIEEKLILPHLDSIVDEIREYKSLYANFVYGDEKQSTLVNFVDELVEDNKKYPLLYFFNVTNIHSIDLINDFHNKLQLIPNYQMMYPLTKFLLQHLYDYENIQYLYPIIKLTNYFLQYFNHRIKRNDVTKKTISQYFQNDPSLKVIYDQFLNVWHQIKLNDDERKLQSENFDNDTNISMFLLNKSKDSENMILVAYLQTFANLQNDIVDYFHSHVVNYESNKQNYRVIPIQSIQQRQLFDFDTNKFRKILIEKCMVINYEYGMSQEIIYDYDEIEWTLRNEISRLPRIDIKNMQYFNYQFELYNENFSLINDIRERFDQKLFHDRKRSEMEQFINSLDNDTILQLSDSLEYILAYLRTITNKNIIKKDNSNVNEILTIQAFIEDTNIYSKISISDKFGREPFASINLEYIIDLYEIIEESIFEKILRKNIRGEVQNKISNNKEIQSIITEFIKMIVDNNKIADCLKNLNSWISMFKRLLVRLHPFKISIDFDLPLADYVKRTDMWKKNVTKENIQTIEIKNHIRLKHAFSILEGLETEKQEIEANEKRKDLMKNGCEQQNNRNALQPTSSIPRSTASSQPKKPPRKSDLR
jgi:hypothetical protein